MYKRLIIVALVVWVDLLGVKSTDLPEKYAKLDQWLSENVAERALNKIFVQEAQVFLESNRDKLSEDEIEAVELFKQLGNVLPTTCDKKSAKLIEHIAKDANIDTIPNAEQETTVQLVVWRHAYYHAGACRRIYGDKLISLDTNLILGHMYISLMMEYLLQHLGYKKERELVRYEQDSPEMKHILETAESKSSIELIGKIIRNTWLRYGRIHEGKDFKHKYDEETGEKYIDKRAVASHLKTTYKFIIEYLKRNKDFVDLVSFDAKIGFTIKEVYPDLNNKIANYRFCRALMKQSRQAIVDEIVRQIDSE